MDREEVEECKAAWIACLRKYGAERPLMPNEDVQIARAIRKYGAEFVKLAILGAQYEPESKDFKPSRYLRLTRILRDDESELRHKTGFQYFVNLGAQARNKIKAREEEEQKRQKEWGDMESEARPEDVRAIINGVLGGMK